MTTDDSNSASHSDVAIVGAGPIGLETAAMLTERGFRVTVFDQGPIGSAVRSWGHVRLFTPFAMNRSDSSRELVGQDAPDDDELLTGRDFAERWLIPLAEALGGKVTFREHHRVCSVGRESLRKGNLIGSAARSDSLFRLLVRDTSNGRGAACESVHRANFVIDCSGFTSRHRWIGNGGIPCPGEQELLTDSDYRIPDFNGTDRARFENRCTLVAGSGYSAATAVSALADLQTTAPNTFTTWLTNAGLSQPLRVIHDDPLPERAAITERVNRLVNQGANRINWVPGGTVEQIARPNGTTRDSGFAVTIRQESTDRTTVLTCDNIVALPGYRPDTSPFEELQVHRCFATEGPMKLAAHLMGEGAGDCLQQTTVGAELLRNPEPDFYVLGAASYGRNSAFLLRTGIEQSRLLVDELSQRKTNA